MIGETIANRYEIIRALGEGGMGAVYEAKHTSTGRRVALKVIHPDKLRSPQLLARFRVEARATGGIESEHVVQVFDVDVDEAMKIPFIAMELLVGPNLGRVVDLHGALPPSLALRIASQICLGLEKAHLANVLHRDIKPANLILAERDGGERRIKIVDFGLAKVFDKDPYAEPSPALTMSGMLLGSPQYMSPEQARASKTIDARSDVWAVGTVLYEMLTGRTAFEDVSPLPKLLEAINGQPVTPVRTLAPHVEVGIAAAVEKALEIQPDRRHESIAAMRAALAGFIAGDLRISDAEVRALPPRKLTKGSEAMRGVSTVAARPLNLERKAPEPEPAPGAPSAGKKPVLPTKVSNQPRPDDAPATQVSRAGGVLSVITAKGTTEPQHPPAVDGTARRGKTLVSGETPAPMITPAPPSRTMDGVPATERGTLVAAPAARTARPRSPRLAFFAAAIALAGAAAFAGWSILRVPSRPSSSQTNTHATSSPAAATTIVPAVAASSTPAQLPAPAPQNPLLGRWKGDTGRLYEAVERQDKSVELRIANVEGFEQTGYRLHDVRFVLKPSAQPGVYAVIDRVLPQLNGLTYAASAYDTCFATFTDAGGAPLTAKLNADVLELRLARLAILTTRNAEQSGTQVLRCKDLSSLPREATMGTLSRVR